MFSIWQRSKCNAVNICEMNMSTGFVLNGLCIPVSLLGKDKHSKHNVSNYVFIVSDLTQFECSCGYNYSGSYRFI